MWHSKITLKSWLLLVLMLPLAFAARSQNHANIFVGGQVFFVDADCYSRMTRAKMILEHPLSPIHHHQFENYPQGTKAHTTAPMDYLIALLALALKPITAFPLDLAGALISPLLGCATLLFLWFWGNRMRFAHCGPMLLLFALSPILVHGTSLGRPDHQSLLILLLAIAIGSEWKLAQTIPHRGSTPPDPGKLSKRRLSPGSINFDQIASGLAWGTSLWVSFYEPLILLAAIAVASFLFSRKSLFHSGRWVWLASFSLPILLMLAIEGIPFAIPDRTTLHAFSAWKNSIGELSSVPPFSPLLLQWTGLLLFAAPLLLIWNSRGTNRAGGPSPTLGPLLLLGVVYALTLWQIRWGYFLALVFVMTLPWQLQTIHKRWLIWTLFTLSLWPVLRDWDQRLFPDEARSEQLASQRLESFLLRNMVEMLRSPELSPILAPWWMCPSIAYWSGQPTIAGSSHESLPGILDTARFYLSENPEAALQILQERGVKWVLVCEPSKIIETSKFLVNQEAPNKAMILGLYEHPHTTPKFLRLQGSNPLFKCFAVEAPGPSGK